MTVSIIIAVKAWQKNLEECVGKCLKLDYSDFEIIILPDELFSDSVVHDLRTKSQDQIRVVPTGPLSPGEKRDVAIKHAHGEILAFIDDDVYPVSDWLQKAVSNFSDPLVAAVGGPAVTPSEDGLMQQASGLVYSSLLVSGPFAYRYVPGKKRAVVDYPSCNLLVRKTIMEQLGGFDTRYWPGEDTKLCLDITKKLKQKIIYEPAALVYHHRRPLFVPHLKQIASYALHRGYFAKKYPQTSFKISYFLPSILFLFLFGGGILSIFLPVLRDFYLLFISVYLFLTLIFSLNKKPLVVLPVFMGILMTHLDYGIYFIKGIFTRKLKEEV
ncbi:MAG: glycosyltransferase [Candidatus Omnitrophota bacterium]